MKEGHAKDTRVSLAQQNNGSNNVACCKLRKEAQQDIASMLSIVRKTWVWHKSWQKFCWGPRTG
eukprot:1161517-Pelagomonas_calceolata.AAC.16